MSEEKNKVFHQELLNELLTWGKDVKLERKVRRIHALCVRQRHIDLADRIYAKYSEYFPMDDMIAAIKMANYARKHLNS